MSDTPPECVYSSISSINKAKVGAARRDGGQALSLDDQCEPGSKPLDATIFPMRSQSHRGSWVGSRSDS